MEFQDGLIRFFFNLSDDTPYGWCTELHCKYIDILVQFVLVFADPKYLMWNLRYVSREQ